MGSLMQTPLASINATLELLDQYDVTTDDWNRLRRLSPSKLRPIINVIRFGTTGYFPAYAQVEQVPEQNPLTTLEDDPRFEMSKAFREFFLDSPSSDREKKVRIGKVTPRVLDLLTADGSVPVDILAQMCRHLLLLGHLPLQCEDAAALMRNELPGFFMWVDMYKDRYNFCSYETRADGTPYFDYTWEPTEFSVGPDDPLCFELGW